MPELGKGESEDKEEEAREIGDKLDDDFEYGNDFKDQLVPLALEYYMEVIEDDDDDDDDDDAGSDKDSDDDKPKGGKDKGKKKGGKKKDEDGGKGDGQECK